MRDRLLGRPTKDIDVVCVGDGIQLANRVGDMLRPRPNIAVYKRFGTAMLRSMDLEIEFVGARKLLRLPILISELVVLDHWRCGIVYDHDVES